MVPTAARGRVAPSLGVSIVTYAPDAGVLGRTLASLGEALRFAQEAGDLGAARATLIDNGPDAAALERVTIARRTFQGRFPAIACRIASGHGNVGYGAGHNLAILGADTSFHLVLNPDVLLEPEAISAASRFMQAHPDVGWLSPRVTDERGALEYLCKRYPSPLVLAIRGFAPAAVRSWFARSLARYEMRDLLPTEQVIDDVPIATGAFMFCRTRILQAVGGFDPAFFLYFEDFDLSLRVARVARIAYVPSVRIVHFGGRSARKGLAHIRMFAASGLRFFRKHGWRRPDLAQAGQARL